MNLASGSINLRMLELLRECEAFQRIHIEDEVLKRAAVFARKVVSTVNYKESSQFEVSKIKSDHFISKIGEEAVKMVFERHCRVTGPDYSVYSAGKKSWDTDLMVGNIGLAVKTQTRSAAKRYGLSWTFQSSEYRKDPILNDSSAWVIFVEYEDVDFTHDCIISPPLQMNQLTFKEPALDHLKGRKKVVYRSDLPVPKGKTMNISTIRELNSLMQPPSL
jgi:hypothetical protein